MGIAKLWGLDAAMRVDVTAGISEREFSEKAAELLRVTGIKPLAELALPVLEPAERAELFAEPRREQPGDDGWSNIGVPTPYSRPEPGNELFIRINNCADDDQDAEPVEVEVVEEVVAEIIDMPRPTSQRSIRRGDADFGEILIETEDGTFIPVTRSGVGRGLGGYSYGPCDQRRSPSTAPPSSRPT